MAQSELALGAVQPCPPSATVSLLGLDSVARISGLVIDVGQGRPVVTFKWKRSLCHEPGMPPALATYGDVEPAEVSIDGDRIGEATVMGILRAILVDCETEVAADARCFLEGFRSALAAHRLQREEPVCRRALAVALAGPALRLLSILARQRLLDEVWQRRIDWQRAVCAFDALMLAGTEDLAVFALLPEQRRPSAALARRIARISDPQVASDFVRVGLAIQDPRERTLFEQALLRTLQSLYKAWRDSGRLPTRLSLVAACRLAISLADRAAFCSMRQSAHPRFDADAIIGEFALKFPPRAVSRPLVEGRSFGAVRVAVLYSWVRRVERELLCRLLPQPEIVSLQAESNEVLEAATLGFWNCQTLQAREWDELVQFDWPVAEPIDLPKLTWRCKLPAEGVPLLSRAGITVVALDSTVRLQAEADEMQNCLASSLHYLTALQLGRSRIYALKGALRVTLEVCRDDAGGWTLHQVRGVRNAPHEIDCFESTDERWQAVRDFVAAVCTPMESVD